MATLTETFWYYFNAKSPEEGSVFPFPSQSAAEDHAGDLKEEMTFAEREATEEERALIAFGRGQLEFLYKYPPPNEHLATEHLEEAWQAWVKYAEKTAALLQRVSSELVERCGAVAEWEAEQGHEGVDAKLS